MPIELYDAANIAALDWPTTPDGDYARRYLLPFIQHGPQTYIANVHTRLQVLRVGDTLLPITPTDYHPDNSYVCSPYNHYITYGQEEFRELKNPPVEAALRALFVPIGWYFRRNLFDRVVYVNNWLLSTNLYPALSAEVITAALNFLVAAFPDRAIVFRSVDSFRNPLLYATLLARGCRMVFSRNVYYQEVSQAWVRNKQQFKFDLKLYQRSPYTVINGADLPPDAWPRVVELYNALYLQKYSYYNPQFTAAFVRLALEHNLLTIKAFQREGRLDAVLGYFERHGVITPPLFGYDTSLPQKLGLYRLLSMRTSLDAIENNWLVHFSAGVGRFKRLRGGVSAIEYNAVHDAHLPPARRRPWTLLKGLLDGVAIPIIQKYEF